jgi:ribonuclease VapC
LIVVDTSALCAILFQEPGAQQYAEALALNDAVIGAPNQFEFLMVATGRLRDNGPLQARAILQSANVRIVAWEAPLTDIAAEAFFQFGKGRNKAALNYGDCMAYALAKSLDAPLLFKGDDFSKTDIRSAL